MTRQKSPYRHQITQRGSDQEKIERRGQLQLALVNRTLGPNHKAGILAVAELSNQLSPQPTEKERDAKVDEGFKQVAQRLRRQGDEMSARRVLESAGLDMDELSAYSGFDDSEKAAASDYRIKRDESITRLQLVRGISKAAASRVFHGKEKTERHHLLPPKDERSPQKSPAEELKRQCNLSHGLLADRPMG